MIRNKKMIAAGFMMLAVAFNTTIAQTNADGIPIDKNVKVGKLANGLTYYIRRNV